AAAEIKVKDRQKRSFYLSAVRSLLFNHIVSQRLAHGYYDHILPGDILQLQGSHSWFIAQPQELATLQPRLLQQDLHITAPLIGDDNWQTQNEALQFEQQSVANEALLLSLLHQQQMQSARRAIRVIPQ